jgi:hypothetical protein
MSDIPEEAWRDAWWRNNSLGYRTVGEDKRDYMFAQECVTEAEARAEQLNREAEGGA